MDRGCVEMDLPDSGQVGMGKLFSMGNALIQAARMPFIQKDKKEPVVLERVFMDPNGFHAMLCSDTGDNFSISYKDTKVQYLQGVRGKIIKSVAWNDSCTEDYTKVIIIYII